MFFLNSFDHSVHATVMCVLIIVCTLYMEFNLFYTITSCPGTTDSLVATIWLNYVLCIVSVK